jgi:hypothetical protein
MYRRRRTTREIAFSFDSFLDVVANVVGIILRLIIVAWVGARSYKPVVVPPPPPSDEAVMEESVADAPEPDDPRTDLFARRRRELDAERKRMASEQDQAVNLDQQAGALAAQLANATARRQQLEAERAGLAQSADGKEQSAKSAVAALGPLQERARKLQATLDELEKEPGTKQVLRWRTPVSQPLQTEELLFECREGRVTLIDIGSLLEEAHRLMQEKRDVLRRQWDYSEETRPVGAFRLRFTVEREQSPLEAGAGLPADDRTSYRYSMTGWRVEPVETHRGETVKEALTPGSAFRRVIDGLDANQTAVTFWVYADSFDAYRQLRDVLHERDVVVAGRPLPPGVAIAASSRRGTVSRGQ